MTVITIKLAVRLNRREPYSHRAGASMGDKVNPGSFGQGEQLQCTAMSKRSRKQCKGPAMLGSPNQKCRMHNGRSTTIGAANPAFKHGRSSKYLPSHLGELYNEALSDPGLLEMGNHIALLEARMHQILGESTSDSVVPRWSDMKEATELLMAATKLKLDHKDRDNRIKEAVEQVQQVVDAGAAWDSTWGQVIGIMDQIRKLTDTEVKRKKELNQMIPVERVLILMVALGDVVRRCVSKPEEIMRVQQEFARLITSDTTLDNGYSRVVPGMGAIEAVRG